MLRTQFAIILAKIIFTLTRFLGRGGGSAAPGYYSIKIQPILLNYFANQFLNKSIIIAGTNGKTTTSRLISHYFSQSKVKYIHNRQGSNLERGIVSTCIQNCNIFGKIRNIDWAVWEVDEAFLPKAISVLIPTKIILLNIFRDQMDRYGEVDSIRSTWLESLKELNETEIIYNNDDPQIFYLVEQLKQISSNRKYTSFSVNSSLEQTPQNSTDLLSPIKLVICPKCKSILKIENQTLIGQGKFKCESCGLNNSIATVQAKISDQNSTSITLEMNNGARLKSNIVGQFNAYNLLAAKILIESLGYSESSFDQSLASFKSAFGRMEQITVSGQEFLLCLIKNPTGFNETLKTLFQSEYLKNNLCLILNDRYADGKDVSWIWDVPFSQFLSDQNIKIFVAGDRASDMALRCKYANINESNILIFNNITDLINKLISTQTDSVIPICATYTATLELQNHFGKTGVKKEYWTE